MNEFVRAMNDEVLIGLLNDVAGQSLSVLLVEDEESQAMLIAALLRRYGHTVHLAFSGEQAIEKFRQVKPDLVLMDVIMPGLDGYETTSVIRAEHQEWVPIIFLSGLTDATDFLHALKVGGDDFFSKPVDPTKLLAKMNVMGRVHSMQLQLSLYRAEQEKEAELASLIMNHYLDKSRSDPRVEYSVVSASPSFCGDAISVIPTPDGGLSVMMLDAMGHGLHAAINLMPAITAFIAMSKKGLSLETIVAEINDKVLEYSIPGNFLAGTFLHLDPTATQLTAWIGGTPKVYLNNEGETQTFSSNNLPLGILPASELDFQYISLPWSERSVLLTCTDGVFESQGAGGEHLGEDWVQGVVQKYGNALSKATFAQVWQESLGANSPNDDAAVLIISQEGFPNS
jgi:CheY-like chemotaxis protein